MRYDFPASGPVIVSATLRASDLALTASDTAEQITVDVVAVKGGQDAVAETRVELDDGRLLLDAPRATGPFLHLSHEVRLTVVVPAGSSLTADSGSGDVRVRGALADAEIRAGSADVEVDVAERARIVTGSGGICVERAIDMEAEAGSGDIRVGAATGRAQARTGSGDIAIGQVRDARIVTGSGGVSLGRVEGRVSMSAGSGDLTVREASTGEIEARSASGDVAVGVAPGTATFLDCHSVAGRVTSDLEAGGGPAAEERRLVLRLRSVSGDVRVRRA